MMFFVGVPLTEGIGSLEQDPRKHRVWRSPSGYSEWPKVALRELGVWKQGRGVTSGGEPPWFPILSLLCKYSFEDLGRLLLWSWFLA